MALTILPSFIGLDGSMRTPQNICMWILPLSTYSGGFPFSHSGVWLQKHERNFTFRREHRLLAVRFFLQAFGHIFQSPVLSVAAVRICVQARLT